MLTQIPCSDSTYHAAMAGGAATASSVETCSNKSGELWYRGKSCHALKQICAWFSLLCSQADFNVTTTYAPASCQANADVRDTVKVIRIAWVIHATNINLRLLQFHYVVRLLATNKVVDSSFHTGSIARKITIGDGSFTPGLHKFVAQCTSTCF